MMAVIGVTLIDVFYFVQIKNGPHPQTETGCENINFQWRGEFEFSSKDGSSSGSGELQVQKLNHELSFRWLQPKVTSKSLSRFLSNPWKMTGTELKVDPSLVNLNKEEKRFALNLLRKITAPFQNPNWITDQLKSMQDYASSSEIETRDYEFSSKEKCSIDYIRVYEQSGSDYVNPTKAMTYTFKKTSSQVDEFTFAGLVQVPLDPVTEVEKEFKILSFSKELPALMNQFDQHEKELIKYLKLGLLPYQLFEKRMQELPIRNPNYRLAISALADLNTDDSIQVILNELKRNRKNKPAMDEILSATQNMKKVSPQFFTFAAQLAKENPGDQNFQRFACHVAGLFRADFPKDPGVKNFILPFLSNPKENLSCLGSAGLEDSTDSILTLLKNADLEVRKQAVYALRFIVTAKALDALIEAMNDVDTVEIAKKTFIERLDQGIFESALWSHLKGEVVSNSKNRDFFVTLGKRFIQNYPGAFRESKLEPQAQYFWK